MKKLTTILLMMCLSCQLVLKLSIVAWFEINQDYIAATLCENKARPELVCCGKCVLTKQLKKADSGEQKDKSNTPTKAEKTAIVVFILPTNKGLDKLSATNILAIQNPIHPNHFEVAISEAIFHPPSQVYS